MVNKNEKQTRYYMIQFFKNYLELIKKEINIKKLNHTITMNI